MRSLPNFWLGGALWMAAALSLSAGCAFAVDHDNIDAGRPLDFDDAETIAFGERALEFGGAGFKPRRGAIGIGGKGEFLLGFRKNWHLSAGFDPQFASQNRGRRRLSAGDFGVSVQHNFNRETEKSPAFGVRVDATLPTGRNSRGVDTRLRGIASRKFGTYGRIHLNADLALNQSPRAGQKRTLPGLLLGYSTPLGLPTRFHRTLAAQIGLRASSRRGEGAILNGGVGLRQQVTPRSVFDVGLKSDFNGGGQNEPLRLIAGYSTAF